MQKLMKTIPVKISRYAFMAAVLFTLFMALIPGSSDPTAGLVHSKVKHIFTFFVLTLMMDRFAFKTQEFAWWKPLSLLGFGILIEVLQWFTGYRTFSVLDMVADGLGISLYYIASLFLWRRLEHAEPGNASIEFER